jgi:uncharacterized protein YbjT (DUF2867 family)
MTRYAVIGASSGTGRQIVRHLADKGVQVRAISRRPPAEEGVEPYAADVTDPASIAKALEGDFDAVFYTVDIHGLRNSRQRVRSVMYDGCVNAIHAAAAAGTKRFVLLSVLDPNRPSWVWWLLNAIKPGMQRNILDRENALKNSGLSYVICRAPRLTDGPGGVPVVVTAPKHRLDLRTGISRADLAKAMVRAAETASENTIWDVLTNANGVVPTLLRFDEP